MTAAMHQTPEIAKKPLALPGAYQLIASWFCQLGCIGVLFLPFVSLSCTDVDYSYFQQKGWRTYNGFQLACEPVTSHFSPQSEGTSKTTQSEKDLATTLDSSTKLYVPTLTLAPMMFVLPMVGLVTLSLACTIFHSNRAVLRQTARTIIVLTIVVIALKLTFQLPFDVLSALIGIPWSAKGSPPPFRLEWLPAYWFSFPMDVLLLWSIRGWFKEQTETQHSAKRILKRLAVASILLAGFWAAWLYVANRRENQYANNLKVAYLSSREGSLDESKQVLASSPTEFREWEWYYLQRLNYVSPYSRWRFGEIGRHYRPRLVMSTTGSKMVLVSNPLPAEPKGSTPNSLSTQPPKITSSRIMVLDTQNGKEAFSLEVPGDVVVACDTYSSEEKLYVYQGDAIKRYSLVSGESDWSVNIANPVELGAWDDKAGLELIDQGRTIVSTLDQGKRIDFWDIESKQKLPPGSRPNQSRGGKGQRSNAQTSALSGDESVSALVDGYRPDVLIQGKGKQDFRFKLVPGSTMVLGTELSYDGARLAIGRIHPVKFVDPPPIYIDIYDTQTGELLGILKCDYGYYPRYHFTRHGDRLLGLRLDTPDQRELDFNRGQLCIDVWDLKELRGGQVLRGHTDSIASIDVSSNGRSVASVSLDGTLRLFDIQRGTCTWTSENLEKNTRDEWGISGIDNDLCVVFSPDDQWIYSTTASKTMNQWDTQTGERSRSFHANFVTNRDRDSNYSEVRYCEGSMIRTSPTGSSLLVSMDGRFSEFDVSKDETSLKTREIDRTGFLSILECDKLSQTYLLVNPFKRNENRAYSNTDLIQLLDAQTGKVVWEKVIPGPTQYGADKGFKPEVLPLSSHLKKLNPNQIKISPNGQWIAGPLKEKTLVILDRESGRIIREIPITESDRFPICWTTDSKRLVHGGKDGRLHIWNPMSGTNLLSIMAHPQGVTCLAVTPDGSKIVSGGKDGLIRVWDASSTY
jgi:WD40 repeat protein